MQLALFVAVTLSWTTTGSGIPATRCNPASHICEGRCPGLPPGVHLPPQDGQGLCLRDATTDACICWLQNPSSEQHLQTLFKCEVLANDTAKHLMCLPPSICFPPGGEPGCMIVLQCPCTDRGPASPSPEYARWHSVVAFIFRSKTPVPALTSAKEGILEKPQGDVREFSVKHLLFLLAFVIAPLLCWCLLTFFHEGKCRKKRQSPETEPMPTERIEEVDELPPETCPPVQVPTAPKFESPPPYREVLDPGESCLLAVDCGPPPSYEDAVRDPRCQAVLVHRIQDMDSE